MITSTSSITTTTTKQSNYDTIEISLVFPILRIDTNIDQIYGYIKPVNKGVSTKNWRKKDQEGLKKKEKKGGGGKNPQKFPMNERVP